MYNVMRNIGAAGWMSHGDTISGNISNAKDVNTSQYKSSTDDHGDCDTSIDPCSGEEMADCDFPGWKSVCAHYGPGEHFPLAA